MKATIHLITFIVLLATGIYFGIVGDYTKGTWLLALAILAERSLRDEINERRS